MNIFSKKQHAYFNRVFTLLVFAIATALVVYMLPRERKFAYEYSKGSPWAYEDLTANFSFAIKKTTAELQAEHDSALKNIKPYFTFDAYVFSENMSAFNSDFNKKWLAYSMQEYRIDEADKYYSSPRYVSLRNLQEYYRIYLFSLIENAHIKGIIRIPDKEEVYLNESSHINMVKGKVSEDIPFNRLYSSKKAYEEITTELKKELSLENRRQASRYSNFFNALDLSNYIQENVFYDRKATELEKNARLKEISSSKGFVQERVLIISRGIIVTQETFQILESYKYEFETQLGNVSNILAWSGRILLTIILFLVVYLFLFNFRREILESFVKTSFILFMLILMIFVAAMVSNYDKKFFYMVPFTILPIILRTFYDERVALFIHVITTLLAGFMALNSFDFVFMNIVAGMVALFSLTNLYHRSRFFLSAFFVVMAYSLTYFGISVVKEGSFSQIEWANFGYFGLNGIFTLLSFLLIYIFEKMFGFLSDTTLMELSDTNQPLLRRLAEMAPATFQHSMQVANLSEDAIRHIGGNPLLVRTGALYHDIGKMIDASYFTENQGGALNPHKDKDLKESAGIIINHVNLGEELAKKNKLPKPIVDFIVTHHGTSTAQYFYKTYINEHPGEDIDKKDFQYPGPKPLSKETAVLMMSDSVEAASRSLENYSTESIDELVERIINSQMDEGQFEYADITFNDIRKVKKVFKTRLGNIYHARIAYPK